MFTQVLIPIFNLDNDGLTPTSIDGKQYPSIVQKHETSFRVRLDFILIFTNITHIYHHISSPLSLSVPLSACVYIYIHII